MFNRQDKVHNITELPDIEKIERRKRIMNRLSTIGLVVATAAVTSRAVARRTVSKTQFEFQFVNSETGEHVGSAVNTDENPEQ